MARHEQDREDLIREATRLVPRAEWHVPGEEAPVVLGIRSPDALSVFFGPDPVFHFNSHGELRRGFVRGALWKADRGRLVVMRRRRTSESVALQARDVVAEEEMMLLREAQERLARLQEALASGQATWVRGVGEDAGSAEFWLGCLATIESPWQLAQRPHVV